MLEFFRRAFRSEKRWRNNKDAEPAVIPTDLPSLLATHGSSSNSVSGKLIYSQPFNPHHDLKTYKLTLETRRTLNRKYESFLPVANPELLICPVDFLDKSLTSEYFDQALKEATEYARRVPKEGFVVISDLLRLTFYVYFKQATEGDITDREIKNQPYVFMDWEGYWKVFGWKRLRGMPREEARDKYVSLLNENVSTRADFAWAPAGYEEVFLVEAGGDTGAGENTLPAATPTVPASSKEDKKKIQTKDKKNRKDSNAANVSDTATTATTGCGGLTADRELEDQRWTSFFEAVRIIRNFPKTPYQMPDDMRARLYALYKQATVGDLDGFARTEVYKANPSHYAWCRGARPADDAADQKKKRRESDKAVKEVEKKEAKAKAMAGNNTNTNTSEVGSSSANGHTATAGDAAAAAHPDMRSFDQLRYDYWAGHEGKTREAAAREYLVLFHATGAAHGYMWDPPGSADHMSEIGNQFTCPEKKEVIMAKGLEEAYHRTTTVSSSNADDGALPRVRRSAKPTQGEDISLVTEAASSLVTAGGDLSGLTAAEKALLQQQMQAAVFANKKTTRESIESEHKKGAIRSTKEDVTGNSEETTSASGKKSKPPVVPVRHLDPVATTTTTAATVSPQSSSNSYCSVVTPPKNSTSTSTSNGTSNGNGGGGNKGTEASGSDSRNKKSNSIAKTG